LPSGTSRIERGARKTSKLVANLMVRYGFRLGIKTDDAIPGVVLSTGDLASETESLDNKSLRPAIMRGSRDLGDTRAVASVPSKQMYCHRTPRSYLSMAVCPLVPNSGVPNRPREALSEILHLDGADGLWEVSNWTERPRFDRG